MTAENKRLKAVNPKDAFLPDFCAGRAVFVLVLVAELFVLTMVLASSGIRQFSWQYLALVSLFVQWVVLISALLICRLQARLSLLSLSTTVIVVYLITMLVTAAASLMGDWVMAGASFGIQHFVFDGLGLLRNLLVSAIMTGMVLRYLYVQASLRRQEQAELESRIQALQSRIRPHFLFNSMNIIASLIASDPRKAEQVVEDLAELFRASLKTTAHPVKLKEELELCRCYVGIERLRLGDRLQVDWDVEAIVEQATIPLLTLQPLLENAIYHGVQPLPEGGIIKVVVGMRDGQVKITVTNPYDDRAKSTGVDSNQIALENISHRIRACYGDSARLSTHRGDGFFVTEINYFCEAVAMVKG